LDPFYTFYLEPSSRHARFDSCPNLEGSLNSQQWQLKFGFLHRHPLFVFLFFLFYFLFFSFSPYIFFLILLVSFSSLGCNYTLQLLPSFRDYLLPLATTSTNEANPMGSSSPHLFLLPCCSRNCTANN